MKRLLIIVVSIAALTIAAIIPLPFEVPNRVMNSAFIARSDADVFNYVTTPDNWPRWHPSSLSVQGATDHPLNVDERVTEHFRVAGHEGSAEWTVVERNAPHRWKITAVVGSRNAGEVIYEIAPENGGSRFTRTFTYYPHSLFALLVDRLSIHSAIEAESSQAVRQLKQILESEARENSR